MHHTTTIRPAIFREKVDYGLSLRRRRVWRAEDGQQPGQDTSSAGTQNTGQQQTGGSNSQPQTVPYDRFSEVIKERNAAQTELEKLRKAQNDAEAQRLADQQKWEELAKKREQDLAALKPVADQVEEWRTALTDTVQAEIQALPEAMRPLVPEYDDPRQTLKWLTANKALLTRPIAPGTDAGARGDGGATTATEDDRALAAALNIPLEEYLKRKKKTP